jgi:hypothetical protein
MNRVVGMSNHDTGSLGRTSNITDNQFVLAKFTLSKSLHSFPGSLAIDTPGSESELPDDTRGVGKFFGHNL